MDMANPKITVLPNGIKLESKLRLGSIIHLEQKYDKKIEEINFASGRVDVVAELMIALALQLPENGDEATVRRKIMAIGINEIKEFTSGFNELFEVELKNQEEPQDEAGTKDLMT